VFVFGFCLEYIGRQRPGNVSNQSPGLLRSNISAGHTFYLWDSEDRSILCYSTDQSLSDGSTKRCPGRKLPDRRDKKTEADNFCNSFNYSDNNIYLGSHQGVQHLINTNPFSPSWLRGGEKIAAIQQS
jgi:hypothetical protein